MTLAPSSHQQLPPIVPSPIAKLSYPRTQHVHQPVKHNHFCNQDFLHPCTIAATNTLDNKKLIDSKCEKSLVKIHSRFTPSTNHYHALITWFHAANPNSLPPVTQYQNKLSTSPTRTSLAQLYASKCRYSNI